MSTKSTRTAKRSRSGASTLCPHCKKMLRGSKGLKMHIAQEHAAPAAKAVMDGGRP